MNSSKLAPLADAIRTHVAPGMHLNFASTPSRSNASIRELARAFRGTRPGFVLSSTGFHSMAHLFALLGLGSRYIGCFFGDHYPIPRPNDLYTRLTEDGAAIEPWSLWAYVSALRAGALGHPYAVTRSLRGTTMGDELAAAGRFVEVADPASPGERLGLVAALRPDITFLHAVMGDEQGNAVFSAPYSEGFWGAHAARRGVVLTIERLVDATIVARHRDAMKIPPHRVLAVCEERFGAHPQPLYVETRFGTPGYPDDFDHYELWREMAEEPDRLATFAARVLDAADGASGYRAFVGEERLERLRSSTTSLPVTGPSSAPPEPSTPPPPLSATETVRAAYPDGMTRATEIQVVLAARMLVARVRDRRYPLILAGIGHSFLAARIAKLWLAEEGIDVKVMVETGLYDIECGRSAHEFLLAHENVAQAGRLSSVEDVLGTLTCGADSACLGVIGAAQVDPRGHVNTTRVGGKLLVGSGGANDIASAAAEVVVLARCSLSRLVREVDYSTSPGWRVRHVVTDLCSFGREADGGRWSVASVYPAHGGRSIDHALGVIREHNAWDYDVPPDLEFAPLLSTAEAATVHRLDPRGVHWRREPRTTER